MSIKTFFMSEDDIADSTDHVREVVSDILKLRQAATPSSPETFSVESDGSVFDGPSTPYSSVDGSDSESLSASESDESLSSSSSSASIHEAVTPIMLPTEPELEVAGMMEEMDLGEAAAFDMKTPKQEEFGGWEKPTQWDSFVNDNAEILQLIH